ncbi:MAG TPA: AAA family ATPase, partial [Spirochaetota bacterium]|nr:AAA family ATPase [Spirochaetota bacterium]HPD79232.1 AAA family ATPase [Spirochaetota bacterium]HPP95810.1 AAA family ATPase [Spirochaetota bacterium]HRS63968.1 AAA family ATPase [Spirochaetota bacterium]HRU65024.1 AAA family ATPase [Spirochaetota bacterium]
MKLKKLPIGESSFENLIKGDMIYVDKTEPIYKMITTSKYFFLSRPRRFGKSLLISTLQEIFK